MSVTFTLPQEYGYVLLAASSTFILGFIHGIHTGRFRGKAKIAYPTCYATEQQAKADENAFLFNCAQRAHANYLENQPSVVAALLIAGLRHPVLAAALGFGWSLNRWIYMIGYTTPGWGKNGMGRMRGAAFWPCQFALFGLVGWAGWEMLR